MKETLKTTCLHDRHVTMGAKMSPFAGYDMPIRYTKIKDEHNAVRNGVGVFDVSHMGEIFVRGRDAEKFVNYVFTNDVRKLKAGETQYGMFLYENGGVVDDLLVYRDKQDTFMMVVNAANLEKDYDWILSHAEGFDVKITDESPAWGQLALQGPGAEKVMTETLGIGEAKDIEMFCFIDKELDGARIIISRTGYTGEDGFEIYSNPEEIVKIWDKFMAAGVVPCGLGCRDTLRFEAGLPLYGNELGPEITPVMAGLGFFCKTDKNFIGRDVIVKQKEEKPGRKLVGIELKTKSIPRNGYSVMTDNGKEVGVVTTGYRSITLDKSICFALVDKEYSKPGTELGVMVHKKTHPGEVVKKKFYTGK